MELVRRSQITATAQVRTVTVAQLLDELARMPEDAVVLMDSGSALSRVSALEFVAGNGPGAPAEVILVPSLDE